jgi:hypothetical protein
VCLICAKRALFDVGCCVLAGKLYSGDSQKLSGRLSWATQFLFFRVGRAMIRPIYDQKKSSDGCVPDQLRVAMCWWIHVLSLELCEEHEWYAPESPVACMWVQKPF